MNALNPGSYKLKETRVELWFSVWIQLIPCPLQTHLRVECWSSVMHIRMLHQLTNLTGVPVWRPWWAGVRCYPRRSKPHQCPLFPVYSIFRPTCSSWWIRGQWFSYKVNGSLLPRGKIIEFDIQRFCRYIDPIKRDKTEEVMCLRICISVYMSVHGLWVKVWII